MVVIRHPLSTKQHFEMKNVLGYHDIVNLIIATKDLAMKQIKNYISSLALFITATTIPQLTETHSFVLCPQVHQLKPDQFISFRYFGCQLKLEVGCPTQLPDIGKNPSVIVFGTKFKQVLCDDKTVRYTSRKPGRKDYLWYDIELVVDNQDEEDLANKSTAQYHWIIKKRDLDEVPLRIPESAIIIYLPADFIAEIIDEHPSASPGTFYLPTFILKKGITEKQLENYLDESDMRLMKDQRFFSNTTTIGTVPTAVQILNS